MKKLALTMTVALALCASMTASATTVIDFEAVALRDSNTNPGLFPYVAEFVDETGFEAEVNESGQKAYYGTDFFNGWDLSDIQSISFTYRNGTKEVSQGVYAYDTQQPYTNIIVSDGSAWGALAFLGGTKGAYTESSATPGASDYYTQEIIFQVNGNDNVRGFEPAGTPAWTHGQNLDWVDVQSFDIMPSTPRPLYSGEAGEPRTSLYHGLTIFWGDSQSNYIGHREIYDVVVTTTDGSEYVAGAVPVPEPATISLLGLGLAGLAARRIRRKK